MKTKFKRSFLLLAILYSPLVLSLVLQPGTALSQGNSAPLLTTLTNPTPALSDLFGESVAAVGSDRVLVGGEGAAEAYLYSLNGALLTTFTNPTPTGDGFGMSVAAVGSDRVLVGAYSYFVGPAQVGRAYLFTTNGTLLTTFTNPTPAVDSFGWSVAAMGNNRVLIGAVGGGAYLFATNGALVLTFTNPAAGGAFGISLAAVGSDRVLIGAPYNNTGASAAGVAYLFRTNGTLLTTITNPAPVASDNFGTAVAAVGNDRLLISAIDYGGAGNGGAAYLFSTNGTLLTTITNPTPAAYDYFGWSVAAVGSSRVLIGAYQDSTDALRNGSAYLFSTNGTLLTTITNPTPAVDDYFAWAVTAVGTDRVLIGGVWDSTGAPNAGSAYLFALPYPPLSIARNGSAVSVSWITAETGLTLQQTDLLNTSPVWTDTTNSVFVTGLTNVVQQPIGTTNRFFRLRRP